LLRAGLSVVLVGAPNVGKSSLLNRLVREDAAIVTPIPGTTRDTVERQVEIAGIPLTIVDTAGLRETTDAVEVLGIARTRAAIARADLALVLVDARDDAGGRPAPAGVPALAGELPARLPRIIVHNKCDLAGISPRLERIDGAHVWLCALDGEGVGLLEAEVRRVTGVEHPTEDAYFARARHLLALNDAARHLDVAMTHVDAKLPPIELFAEELRAAQNAFSSITGEFTADDLLGEIFSRFCIGK
jgi:tRNA modification GTPase